ncbi:hypothetical protein [Rhizobium leguminosarum]|uniref:hypothetical protein n=1 Tax=Rhizobium leguminosarum TaxID=384 RepID=UPI0010300CEA|nr:hypothetical protein [Rhizobium leguminosarum]TAV88191.1 hypothetical protein ELI22_02595 [Rhizobium leguminosarum]TAV92773.1 hypothetical protein ELI21_02605 [Rhizobium leguminosarum]TAW33844.1 hypothetical protein ELI23_02605 [Rhizobium leguminosarum]
MAIPISRFASITGDIAKAQGDGKPFSSLPGQCEELERRSGRAEGQRVLTIIAKRQIAERGRVRQSSSCAQVSAAISDYSPASSQFRHKNS